MQRYYGFGDKQTEYQILDRTSFKLFLGLESGDKVPDEKNVWAFREALTNKGLAEDIFAMPVSPWLPVSVIQNDEDQILHADSAYSGEPCAEIIAKHKLVGQINEKGYKNKPLTEE